MQVPQVWMLEPMSDWPQPSVLLDGLPIRQMIFEIIFGHGIFASETPSPEKSADCSKYTTDEIRT